MIPRFINPIILEQFKLNKIQVLVGTRQTGKTTILRQLQTKMEKQGMLTLYLDLEIQSNLEMFYENNLQKIIDYLKINWYQKDKQFLLLVDEFQKVKTITSFFKVIHDHYLSIKIIATGSSSLLINTQIKEGLTGRKIRYKIFPLSYLEYSRFENEQLFNYLQSASQSYFSEFESSFQKYLQYGGYPEVVTSGSFVNKEIIFRSIFSAYVEKDIAFFVKKDNIPKFTNLVKVLASQVWGLVNKNELAQLLQTAHKTIDKYIFTLENTFIVTTVPPFVSNKRKEISQMPKIYFNDLGLRNYILNNFDITLDIGNVVENYVFLELLKNKKEEDQILFWRTRNGTEIDFILNKGSEIVPIEVKYRNNPHKALKNIYSFIDLYQPKKAFIITKDYFWQVDYGDCSIFFSSAIKGLPKGIFE